MTYQALVTGSSGGIGRALALDLAARGHDVAVHYRASEAAAENTASEARALGVTAVAIQADVTDPDQAKGLVTEAAGALGGLSVVVNNVGDYLGKPLAETTADEWHGVINSNLNSAFHVTQAAIPHLRAAPSGRVVNFACARAQHLVAFHENAAYVVAKTAVLSYTRSLARQLAADDITVNAILPGIVENSFDVDEMLARLPLGRTATLEDMAHAVWFFIDPKSAYVTGQVLEVSGGWNL